jgi:hypothetical protein
MSGDVFRLSAWTHVEPTIRVSYKVPERKKVAVFVHLGYENKDGTEPLDLKTAMRQLGWIPADPELRDEG